MPALNVIEVYSRPERLMSTSYGLYGLPAQLPWSASVKLLGRDDCSGEVSFAHKVGLIMTE